MALLAHLPSLGRVDAALVRALLTRFLRVPTAVRLHRNTPRQSENADRHHKGLHRPHFSIPYRSRIVPQQQ